MQGHGRIIAHDFCIAHREANSGLSTLNRTKSILSIYHQQRQLQKQRGMCLNDTYPFCQQPLSGNCHSICFSKPVLWTATSRVVFRGAGNVTRTHDLLITNQLLYRLSYASKRCNIKGFRPSETFLLENVVQFASSRRAVDFWTTDFPCYCLLFNFSKRAQHYESAALPTELHQRLSQRRMIF